MAMKPTDFMLEIEKMMKEKRGITDSSALQYLQTLYKLNGSVPFKNLAWCKKHEAIEKILEPYSLASKRNMVSVLVSILSLVSEKKTYKACYEYWKRRMGELKEEYNNIPAHEKTEKQEKEWIDWEEVLKKKQELSSAISSFVSNKTLSPKEFEQLQQALVLCLYTCIQPRRNQDYLQMYVVKKLGKDFDKTKNYYEIAGNRFVFNVYKTAKKYGEQVEEVPEELKDILTKYLAHHPGVKSKQKEVKLLVKSDGTPFTTVNSITRVLNKIFGKKVGASMLRHSYLSGKYGAVMKELEKDTEQMAHTSDTAIRDYIKF